VRFVKLFEDFWLSTSSTTWTTATTITTNIRKGWKIIFYIYLFYLLHICIIVVYLTSLCVNLDFFGISEPRVPKKAQFTQERVEYNVFLFDEPLKGSKSLKIFKISLTFCFDKL
jgi:hypothetical protein